jgi:hypothetical protein
MTSSDTKSHFWVATAPFFSSTILVASGSSGAAGATIEARCELFDVDGRPIQRFKVEFPEHEVGIIEVEPFMAGLKMQGGIIQGHLSVESRAGTLYLCRQQVADYADIITAPREIKSREMSFMPLLLGGQREHLVVVVNTALEDAQVLIRLLYGNRSPEWTVQVPGNGCRVVSLEHELLSTFDDTSWHKGVMQGYVRISPRSQSAIVCQMVERLPGEMEDRESYRSVLSW